MLNLLGVLCICMGLGVNSNPIYNTKKESTNREITLKPKRENENETQYNLSIASYNDTSTNIAITDSTTLYYTRSQLQAYNNAINVRGTHYRLVSVDPRDNARHILTAPENQIDLDLESLTPSGRLIILEITPYNINKDTTITVTTGIDIINQTLNNQKPYFTTGLIETTTSLNQYIDSSNVVTNNINKVYQEITSANNGYIYQEQRENYIGQNNQQNYITTISYDINISQGQTKYLCLLIQYGITNNNSYAGPADVVGLGTTFNNGVPINITGTHIIPTGTTEVVDIPGVMFDVLTMPFTFISVAFNLTLFPGTPYQLNLSNLFLVIFAVLVFVFLIKIIVGVITKGG